MDAKDFPIEGPRSLAWFLEQMANGGMTPRMRHSKWVSESGVGSDSHSAHEHSVLSHALEKAVVIDRLNVVKLFCLEIFGRRLILLEEAHAMDPGQPSFEGWEHWLGLGERRAGILIPPELSRHVVKKVGDESAVAKQRRQAKEEKRFGPAPLGACLVPLFVRSFLFRIALRALHLSLDSGSVAYLSTGFCSFSLALVGCARAASVQLGLGDRSCRA